MYYFPDNNNSSLNSTISSFQTTPSNVPINAFEGEIKIENKNPIHSLSTRLKPVVSKEIAESVWKTRIGNDNVGGEERR